VVGVTDENAPPFDMTTGNILPRRRVSFALEHETRYLII